MSKINICQLKQIGSKVGWWYVGKHNDGSSVKRWLYLWSDGVWRDQAFYSEGEDGPQKYDPRHAYFETREELERLIASLKTVDQDLDKGEGSGEFKWTPGRHWI